MLGKDLGTGFRTIGGGLGCEGGGEGEEEDEDGDEKEGGHCDNGDGWIGGGLW